MNILLWSKNGAGPHYHGPGMNAWRMYSNLDPSAGCVRLLHANRDQIRSDSDFWLDPHDVWLDSHCVANLDCDRTNPAIILNRATQYLKQHRSSIDVLHGLSGFYPTVLLSLAAEQMGIPSVVKIVAHDTEVKRPESIRGFHRVIRQKLMRRISAFVAISDEIANSLHDLGIHPDRIHRIPNGVDTELFFPRERGFPQSNTKKILFAGGLVRRKRPHLLLQALSHLNETESVETIFAGPAHEAEYFQEMQRMAEHLGLAGRVHWPGFVHDMPKLMRESDVVCLPSEGEGMANIVLEAMASGVPFVVTPCSGMNELVRLGGGLMAEPDPKDLASKIEDALRNRKTLGERGRVIATNRFSSGTVMKAHLSVFNSLLRK